MAGDIVFWLYLASDPCFWPFSFWPCFWGFSFWPCFWPFSKSMIYAFLTPLSSQKSMDVLWEVCCSRRSSLELQSWFQTCLLFFVFLVMVHGKKWAYMHMHRYADKLILPTSITPCSRGQANAVLSWKVRYYHLSRLVYQRGKLTDNFFIYIYSSSIRFYRRFEAGNCHTLGRLGNIGF